MTFFRRTVKVTLQRAFAAILILGAQSLPAYAGGVSISITATSVKPGETVIYASGDFKTTGFYKNNMEVSTDGGKTWTEKMDTMVFMTGGTTWDGKTQSLANGTYSLRVYIQTDTKSAKVYSNTVTGLKIPGPS